MSGQELDLDGTDSYHPQHPWEQVGHPLYLPPERRDRGNWPPEWASPAGPAEEHEWTTLPPHAKPPRTMPRFRGQDVGDKPLSDESARWWRRYREGSL